MDLNIPDWNTYFMGIAQAISVRSKDPATKVGAILVDENGHIIGTGYNGFPPGIKETAERWERPAKYTRVVHAEMNALLHVVKAAKGATLYTTLFPCADCAKHIISAGIQAVYYKANVKYWSAEVALFLREANVMIYEV